ncbi:formate dehydrogenase accessory protein FdhE [Pseudomonas sp. GOM7]|uniref:formate dehydrogenase accessory protein FdhE n=1 Tax=unclassified Pseudomonas TaxID=196821 RepID=UPI00227A5001|nr:MULTISPECIES: formate dehydrogenase accessory protein FdhE [unclassified Pseudomonas]WAJ36818.1 formate dehydrogenase accessory protein FdhE [Pseudomonas sp. GOM7]
MSGQILEPGQIEAAANVPPFLHLPEADLFGRRAHRLRSLATDHPLSAYLLLMAELCDAQQRVLDAPPALPGPSAEALARSLEHRMPPLGFDTLVRGDAWLPALDALLTSFSHVGNPSVSAALVALREADSGQRKAWAIALLGGQFDLLPAALVPFLGAALQVAFSHWLLALPSERLVEASSQTLCPACGSPPVAGMLRHRGQYAGLRYLCCSLCACEWHHVRVKCSHCESSRHLAYLSLQREGVAPERAVIRAEVCPSCQGYLKQCYLEFDDQADAIADDLASLDLDMRLSEEGHLRRAPNLLLAPGSDG